MSRVRDLLEVAREGTADLLGMGDELVELREAAANGRMLARRMEDLGYGDLAGGGGDLQEMRRMQHREVVDRAFRYYFGDPIVRRAVDLRTFYVFGTGVATPRYSDDPNSTGDDAEVKKGTEALEAWWKDEDNKAILTAASGQYQKELELQAQGNVFLLGFEAERPKAGEAALKLSDLPEREIVDIITHPENRKKNVWYLRQYMTKRWDPATGMYMPGRQVTRYYRDWVNEPPKDGEVFDGEVWENPAENLIATEGRVYQVAVNKTSDMRFGQSELQSILDMAQSLSAYMTNRSAVVRVISKLAMSVKVDGGARSVAQAKSALADAQSLAGALANGGDESLARHRAHDQQATAAVTGRGTDLQPMVADTGAAGAATDIGTMKGHLAAGTGIPLAHLGSEPGALAGSITQDRPLMALIKARQELWRTVIRDLAGWNVKAAGLDPDRVQLSMPALTDRDADATAQTLQGLLTMIAELLATRDPELRQLARWAMAEVLDEMGKENAQQLVDGLIKPDVPELSQEQLYNLAQQTGAEIDDVRAAITGDGGAAATARARSEERAGGRLSNEERPSDGSEGQDSIDRAEDRADTVAQEADMSVLVDSALLGLEALLEAEAAAETEGSLGG